MIRTDLRRHKIRVGGGNLETKIIEPTICAMRGRNPDNPSDRTKGCPTEQRLEIGGGVSNTLTSVQKDNLVAEPAQCDYRIRKLTPRECFRLMDFDDEDFDKAKNQRITYYLEGETTKCNASLKVVPERQRHIDMVTYASCTIRESIDTEILRTIMKKYMQTKSAEKMQSVNFAIEKLDDVAHWECAINTTKCINFMGMRFFPIENHEKRRMDIIVSTAGMNIGKYMKITTELNCPEIKLYTILTLFGQIIESKIYTSTILKANMQGYMRNTTDSKNNIQMQLLNLRMDITKKPMSDSALYKQAGNSIVVAVLEAIFKQML